MLFNETIPISHLFHPWLRFLSQTRSYRSRLVTFNNTSGFLYVSLSLSSEAIPVKIISLDVAASSLAYSERFHLFPLPLQTAKHMEKPSGWSKLPAVAAVAEAANNFRSAATSELRCHWSTCPRAEAGESLHIISAAKIHLNSTLKTQNCNVCFLKSLGES